MIFKKIFFAILRELSSIKVLFIINYPNSSLGRRLREKYFRKKLNSKLGKRPIIFNGVEIYNDAPLEIGDNFSARRNVTIDANDSFGIIIGNDVGIAEGSILRAGNHDYTNTDKPFKEQGHIAKKIFSSDHREASIIIEDDVWIASNCVILSGAKIGKGSIVSAGSVVAGKLPEYSLSVGNPARPISSRKNISFSKKYYHFP